MHTIRNLLMRYFLLAALIFASLTIPYSTRAQPCDDGLPPRLIIGQTGRVLSGTAVNVRPEPGTQLARIAVAAPGVTFDVIDGPSCADGFNWWQVIYSDGGEALTGWLAEGSPASGDYWLEARGRRVIGTDRHGQPMAYVMDADGTLEPEACLTPPEDYTRIQQGYATLNARTIAMLDHAQRIYAAGGGFMNFRQLITQGSYNPGGVTASFGTHDGGGAVDISVRSPLDWSVQNAEIEPMIDALRLAGFAAWLRAPGELYPNSPIHIHAIAVGDAELSPIARQQIDGAFGYLRGYNGLPQDDGLPPLPDRHGGPVICRWMIDAGFGDLREVEQTAPASASHRTPAGRTR